MCRSAACLWVASGVSEAPVLAGGGSPVLPGFVGPGATCLVGRGGTLGVPGPSGCCAWGFPWRVWGSLTGGCWWDVSSCYFAYRVALSLPAWCWGVLRGRGLCLGSEGGSPCVRGKACREFPRHASAGASPCVRGQQSLEWEFPKVLRFIPALAGSCIFWAGLLLQEGVHPCGCGGSGRLGRWFLRSSGCHRRKYFQCTNF